MWVAVTVAPMTSSPAERTFPLMPDVVTCASAEAKIAVAAYIENAGFGATWAAPIASLLVEKYLNGEISDQRRGLEDRVLQGNLMSRVKAYK